MTFGADRVKVSQPDDKSLELTIDLKGCASNLFKTAEVSIYRVKTNMAFMLIDDFRFEYSENLEKAILEIKDYLLAIKENRVKISGLRILGIQLNSKIVITK
jgi:hypothetical protein